MNVKRKNTTIKGKCQKHDGEKNFPLKKYE